MQPNLASYNVLAPGPVNLHPAVLKALALPMIHHRTPEFDAILKRVLARLKKVFKTKNDCYILSSTGSGGMEALLINVLRPQAKVLSIDCGKFGERWAEMAKTFQAEVLTHKVPWGQSVKLSDLENLLAKNPDTEIVLCQACETSTGIKNDIQAMGQMLSQKYPKILFLVDGITALGAYPLPMDEWHIDGLVGGSQKAFMLPTGLSLLSFSEKAWSKIDNNPTPRFYFDIRKEKKANQSGETFFSSNVTLIRALDVVLELFEEKGIEALYQEIAQRAEMTRKMGLELGFKLYAENPSESVTALEVPPGYDGQKIRALLESKYHVTIMGGQDQAKGKIIRIGHMGYIQEKDMQLLKNGLTATLKDLKN